MRLYGTKLKIERTKIHSTCRTSAISDLSIVGSVVEHSSPNPKVPSLILRLTSNRLRMSVSCKASFMHVTPGVVHNFSKALGV